MSTYLKYVFPAANTQDLCLVQNTTGMMNLILNGNLADNNYDNEISFIARGYSRQVSFTSTNDLSGATFTIIGIQNGVLITENVTGPNNNTVYSAQIYDVVTFVTVNTAVAAIQVGTGHSGYFPLVNINLTTSPINYTISLGSLFATNRINTMIHSTLDNISQNGSTYTDIIANNISTLFTVKASSNENLYLFPVSPITSVPVYNELLVHLAGSASTIGNSVTMIFIQI